ncbi:MAG: S41 family peptidase [Ignavibacteriales bacterium]|nr:S41 family peptidase [Ignavibacteriales bacterium]
MKTALGFLLCAGALYLLMELSASAQEIPPDITHRRVRLSLSPPQPQSESFPRYRISGKKASQYSKDDWRRLIDSTWGPGLPTDQKLQIFDGFWNNVNMYYGGFPNLDVNWDSLKNVFRPEVAQGVSRGRFAGILSNMVLALRDGHTLIIDQGIDSVSFRGSSHRPRGVPILGISGWCAWGMGATMTPLPDSSLLVIQVDPHQPLGLKAGDIVLGYDRVPWKQLIRQLLDAQLPVASLNWGLSMWGASPESWTHNLLTSAACNWYLFDSLDVIRYSTSDTVHLPTWKLDNTDWDSFGYAEQLPVKGVPIVERYQGPQCTRGIVEGTNVGYVYIRDWYSTTSLVSAAVNELTNVKKVDGLIIDFRVNGGGSTKLLSELGGLFNSDPWVWLSDATRTSTSDKMDFKVARLSYSVPPKQKFYDRPIAVLTGPECGSIGDWGAFFMRSHPMVRFFGKPTSTAYGLSSMEGYYLNNLWYYGVSKEGAYSNYPGEGHLVHKGFDVDERVWFAKDDVAKGDDTIVKRALEWIAGLTHGHDVTLAKQFGKPAQDTIRVTTTVENPQKHAVSVWSYLSDRAGALVDSCQLLDDGLHNDGVAGDKVYGGRIGPPTKESTYGVSLRTTDITAGTYRHLQNAQRFFTNGPVNLKGWTYTSTDTIPNPGDVIRVKFRLINNGKTDTVRNVTATIAVLDTMVSITSGTDQLIYGNLLPGKEALAEVPRALKIQPVCPPNIRVQLLMNIMTEEYPAWIDTVSLLVQPSTNSVVQENNLPAQYFLHQNHPNPFNPSTSIAFSIPNSAIIRLQVFDLLGREVAVLVNEEKPAGKYSVTWDASAISSGIYFYRLDAAGGERLFSETKKCMVVK